MGAGRPWKKSERRKPRPFPGFLLPSVLPSLRSPAASRRRFTLQRLEGSASLPAAPARSRLAPRAGSRFGSPRPALSIRLSSRSGPVPAAQHHGGYRDVKRGRPRGSRTVGAGGSGLCPPRLELGPEFLSSSLVLFLKFVEETPESKWDFFFHDEEKKTPTLREIQWGQREMEKLDLRALLCQASFGRVRVGCFL